MKIPIPIKSYVMKWLAMPFRAKFYLVIIYINFPFLFVNTILVFLKFNFLSFVWVTTSWIILYLAIEDIKAKMSTRY